MFCFKITRSCDQNHPLVKQKKQTVQYTSACNIFKSEISFQKEITSFIETSRKLVHKFRCTSKQIIKILDQSSLLKNNINISLSLVQHKSCLPYLQDKISFCVYKFFSNEINLKKRRKKTWMLKKFKIGQVKNRNNTQSVNQNSTLMSAWDKINYGSTSLSSFEVQR